MYQCINQSQEFCAPWKRKRDEEAEKQVEAATALAQQKQRLIEEEEEASAARAEQPALRAAGGKGEGAAPLARSGHGAISMGGLGGKGEREEEGEPTVLEEGRRGVLLLLLLFVILAL